MALSRRSVLRGLGVGAAVGGVGAVNSLGSGTAGPAASATALVAGSLLELANRLPGASVEAHGSVAVRRLVLDGLREPDAVALADPHLFEGIADRVTLFATNALVLTYAPDSSFADAVEADWNAAIQQREIRLGRTDPAKDPLGYRTILALRLAQRQYGVDADAVLDRSSVFLETDLLNVIEGGQLDAAFTYRNMAVQRDLPFVELPDAIDFSDPDLEATYRTVSFDLDGERIRGAPIRYAASALTEAGVPWTDQLVSAEERLVESGFTVPSEFPVRTVARSR